MPGEEIGFSELGSISEALRSGIEALRDPAAAGGNS